MEHYFQNEDCKCDFPIDLVYTWVDGHDLAWKRKNEFYKRKTHGLKREAVKGRFENHNELLYSLRSVAKYMPWINHIFIITDHQVPKFLNLDNPKITIVDHTEIFDDLSLLPTFCSDAIEWRLPFIPGLSEHFIYSNDDMLAYRPTYPSFFFTKEGKPIVRVNPNLLFQSSVVPFYSEKMFENKEYKKILEQLMGQFDRRMLRTNKLIYERFGKCYFHRPYHGMDPYLKSASLSVINDPLLKDEIRTTVSHRFRSETTLQRHAFALVDDIRGRNIMIEMLDRENIPEGKEEVYEVEFIDNQSQMDLILQGNYSPYQICAESTVSTTEEFERQIPLFLQTLFPEPCEFECETGLDFVKINGLELLSEGKQARLLKYAKQFEPLIYSRPDWDRVEVFQCRTERYETPKVSVIMPVYNVAPYLFHSITSILNQTCQEIEVICVEDCSTDNSLEILEFFALLDARVKVLRHEKNLHVGEARNTGIRHAKGEYIYFLDPDDWCNEDTLQELLNSAKQYNSDVVISRGLIVNSQKNGKIEGYTTFETFGFSSYIFDELLHFSSLRFNSNSSLLGCYLFRKEFIYKEGISFPNRMLGEDTVFIFLHEISGALFSVCYSRNMYFHRLFREGSLTSSTTISPTDAYQIFLDIGEKLERSNLLEKYHTVLANTFLGHINWVFYRLSKGESFRIYYEGLRNKVIPRLKLDDFSLYQNTDLKKFVEKIRKNSDCWDYLAEMNVENNFRLLDQLEKNRVICQSASYRLGHTLLWPMRMLRRSWKCYRDEGIVMLLKRVSKKCLKK